MVKAVADTISVARFIEVYHYTGEDGYPSSDVFSPVGITLKDGRQFFLPTGVRRTADEDGFGGYGYRARYDTDAMIARIEAAGRVVDLRHWVELEPFDLESELEAEAERERWERDGY